MIGQYLANSPKPPFLADMTFSERLSAFLVVMFFLLPLEASGVTVVMSLVLLAAFHFQPSPAQALRRGWPVTVLLTSAVLIGVVFSLDPVRSLQGVGKLAPAVIMLYLLLLSLRKSWFSSGRGLRFAVSFGLGLVLVTFLASQVLHGGYVSRQQGLFAIDSRNSISVALLFVMCAVMGLYQSSGRWPFVVSGILMLWVLMANGGRGAFVAGAAVFVWAVMRHLKLKASYMLIGAATLALIGMIVLWLWGMPAGMVRTEGGFLTGRGSLWMAAIQVIRDYPLTGIGINVWKHSAYVHSLSDGWINQPSPHNFMLDLLTSVGFIGAFLMLVGGYQFSLALRSSSIQVAPDFNAFGSCLLVGFLVNALVDFRVFSVQFFVAIGFGMVLCLAGTGSLSARSLDAECE